MLGPPPHPSCHFDLLLAWGRKTLPDALPWEWGRLDWGVKI